MAEGEVWAGVWVYLPIAPSQSSGQLLSKLKAAGIDDALEMPGPSESSVISLGLFADQKRAQTRVAQAQALGFNPGIADRKRTGDVYWIDIDLKPTDSARSRAICRVRRDISSGWKSKPVRMPERRHERPRSRLAVRQRARRDRGYGYLIACLALVAFQTYRWFQNGEWTHVGVNDGMRAALAHLAGADGLTGWRAALARWLDAPVTWLGLHTVLEALPASLALFRQHSRQQPVRLHHGLSARGAGRPPLNQRAARESLQATTSRVRHVAIL